MDLVRWGLRERPFRVTVTPHGATLLPGQDQAYHDVRTAFRDWERVAVLVGPAGVGKTLVAQHLVATLEEEGLSSAWAACVPGATGQAVYQMLLADLGEPFELRSPIELRLQLIGHLLGPNAAGKRLAVVCDEAHHLAAPTLEELRPLIELVSPGGAPLVHLLLTGTEQLLHHLGQPEAGGLRAWVGCHHNLEPLDATAAVAFVQRQWQAAGGDPRRHATDEAWQMIAELGLGVPLLLNRLARRAFRWAELNEQKALDAEAVWEAATDLGLTNETDVEDTVRLPVRNGLKESA